jgi:hypothetical protein
MTQNVATRLLEASLRSEEWELHHWFLRLGCICENSSTPLPEPITSEELIAERLWANVSADVVPQAQLAPLC